MRRDDVQRLSRGLLFVAAGGLLIVGAVSFVLPVWASGNFPWSVGPFLAMTIGGWALGTAGIAWRAARIDRLDVTYPLLVFLWVFGAGQLAVVLAFLDKLQTGHLLTYPYLLGIGALVVSAVLGTLGRLRHGTDPRTGPGSVPRWAQVTAVVFSAVVLVLVAGNVVAGPDGVVAQGRFFPERMSLFSIRAFAAFFFALSASAFSLVFARDLQTYLEYARSGMLLLVPITVAALLNLSLFDFAGRPGGLVYLGAYVVVGILSAIFLLTHLREPGG